MSFVKYLRFLWKSTNEHGVHSPFVFSFVTKGLYRRTFIKELAVKPTPVPLSKKQWRLLLQSIVYFNIKHIYTDNKVVKIRLSEVLPKINVETTLQEDTYDLLFITQNTAYERFLNYMHNDSVLIIANPHSEENKPTYQTLVSSVSITVCIDVYSLAFIFIRREQSKQTFFIRA